MENESATCKTCNKTSENLKQCAKCQSVKYCSRDCQKADWKTHKKVCSSKASSDNSNTAPNSSSTTKGLTANISLPFTRLQKGTWLHDRPQEDVFRLLIDSYRLRMQDNYALDGIVTKGSIYAGSATGQPAFREFTQLAESRAGLMPTWWDAQKQAECEQFGTTDSWSDLSEPVDKGGIIERYGNSYMPMQLRMFAEAVYQRGIGGQDGSGMRQMMVQMEQGSLKNYASSLVDASSMINLG